MRAPLSEGELLERARELSGRTVGELGAELGCAVPSDQRRAKGLVGTLMERALGATAESRGVPDFEALSVELKTLPVDAAGRPKESTFVCTLPLSRVAELAWAESPVYRKMARVLWVPVERDPARPLAARRIGMPILWSPSEDEEATLRHDWDELVGRIGVGDIEGITAHLGTALQVRPKAAHSRITCRAHDADAGWVWTVPKGFYLRARFTAGIVERALAAPR
jgi:DNA mismatch repair protein MutH